MNRSCHRSIDQHNINSKFTLFHEQSHFFYKEHFLSNARLKWAKKLSKAKQHPEAELLANMSKKYVCLYQWGYMINCNENENDNDK